MTSKGNGIDPSILEKTQGIADINYWVTYKQNGIQKSGKLDVKSLQGRLKKLQDEVRSGLNYLGPPNVARDKIKYALFESEKT